MTPLLDTKQLAEKEAELGMAAHQLLTPLTGYKLVRPGEPFAVDNGAFSDWRPAAFERRLASLLPHRDDCLFVSVPDVIASRCMTAEEDQKDRAGRNVRIDAVGNARQTLAIWHERKELFPYLSGWPLAFVAQDGAEDLDLPWRSMRALFIGGSTSWKESAAAAQLVRAAKIRGLHVHVGRVNGPRRWRHFESLGADTADGTGLVFTTRQREAIRDRHGADPGPAPLFQETA